MAVLNLSFEEAKADLEALAAERPDYVYKKLTSADAHGECYYFDPQTGAPSCIVGHVLARHGVTIEPDDEDNHTDVWGLESGGWLQNEDLVLSLLSRAQAAQDMGVPWGKAVREAIDSIDPDDFLEDDE